MRRIGILSVLLVASITAAGICGCKKEESEEPVILYYGGEQTEQAAITLQPIDQPAVPGETEILAPIIAGSAETEVAVTAPSDESQETESSETTETSETSETTAAETTETTAAAPAEATPVVSSSYVNDGAGVIANESAVNSAMASFESETGVSPAIFTISNQLSGDDFRQYARDIYSANYSDQDHVLIVYQLTPAGTWSWTCVFGTNTGTVFDQDTIDQFQTDLTNAFSSSNVDNALVTTFDNAAA